MEKVHNPHDRYFRASMSDLRVAKSFLQAHLSTPLQKIIRWDSLRLEPNQHVSHALKQSCTDVLYRAKMGDQDGFISILVEHQSTVDRLMSFRILRYCTDIMAQHLKSHPGANLPLVIPLVFYSGQAPYQASTDLFTLFGEHETLARSTFLKPFQLIDLCRISDDELRAHTWASVMEMVQKHARSKDFIRYCRALIPILREIFGQAAHDYLMSTLQYIWNTAELDNSKEFVKMIETDVSAKIGENTMTLAEVFRQEGYEKAQRETKTLADVFRQEGYEKAQREAETLAEVFRQEGYEKAQRETKTLADVCRREDQLTTKREIAAYLMKKGLDPAFVVDATGLSLEEINALTG